MSMTPVYIDEDITMEELSDMARAAGFMLRSDDRGRTVIQPVPPFLRHDPPVLSRCSRAAREWLDRIHTCEVTCPLAPAPCICNSAGSATF